MDARGDLYSVGILMYEAFTGSLPFEKQASDAVAMIFSHVNDVPGTAARFESANSYPARTPHIKASCEATRRSV